MPKKFDNLIVIGRPACGKSEFLDFLRNKISDSERLEKLHVAPFKEVDDFPWLWQYCSEDDIWEKLGHKRLISKRSGNAFFITDHAFYDFLIEKINDSITKNYTTDFYKNNSTLIEFSRGKENAYKNALWLFSKDILKNTAIIYIKVSHEESLRRNEARYQEKLKSSILAHKTPDEEMRTYYVKDDWSQITDEKDSGYLNINGSNVPFVTMDNEPESKDEKILEKRYSSALQKLMGLYDKRIVR